MGTSAEPRMGAHSASHAARTPLDLGPHALAAGRTAPQALDGLDELAQHQPCVAQQGMIRDVALVEVALVVGGVDDGLARRNAGRHAVPGEAAADAEHDVGLAEVVQRVPGHRGPAGTERERMILREGALALEGRHHRRLEQLGQLAELLRRLRIEHALAGVDDGPPRVAQHPGGRLDVAHVGAGARGLDRAIRVDQGVGRLLVHDVGGDLHHRRARTAHAHEADRPAHDLADLAALGDGLHALGDGGEGASGAEEGEDLGPVARVPERQEQHRGGVGVRGGDAGEGVLGAWPVLHAERGELLSVRHPRVAVGDAHADPLLAAEHRPDLGPGRGLDHRRGRVGAQELGALDLEDAGDGVDDFHGRPPGARGIGGPLAGTSDGHGPATTIAQSRAREPSGRLAHRPEDREPRAQELAELRALEPSAGRAEPCARRGDPSVQRGPGIG
jgi:hypothetical protein